MKLSGVKCGKTDETIKEYKRKLREYSEVVITESPLGNILRRVSWLLYQALLELSEIPGYDFGESNFKTVAWTISDLEKTVGETDEAVKRARGQLRLAVAAARRALLFVKGARTIDFNAMKQRNAVKAAKVVEIALDALMREVSSCATGFDGNLRPEIAERLKRGRDGTKNRNEED